MAKRKRETPEENLAKHETPERPDSTIKVEILKILRGITFCYDPGQRVELEREFALSLIAEKAAKKVD